MAVHSSVLITSQKQNRYFFDKNLKKLTLCHPVFYRLIEMDQRGEDLNGWVQQLDSPTVDLEGIGVVSSQEISYYYKKYLLFKENGCFSDRDLETKKSASMRPEDVEALLANVGHIVFEVTDRCNLKCEYCAYGRFYDNFAPRKNRNMDPEMARRTLDYFLAKIRTARNDSLAHRLIVGFYGGEPLLNFPLIRETVDYLGRIDLSGIIVNFEMTTNGLLLDKHMDFLVKHDFSMLISLDGDEENNGYRVDKKGKPVFSKLFSNVKALQAKYPQYFKTKINFNVVIHNRNSISDTIDFFKKEFDLFPIFSPLSLLGIREEAKAEFKKIYKDMAEDLKNCSESVLLDQRVHSLLPDVGELLRFLKNQNSFEYSNFNRLLSDEKKVQAFFTGTCMPFQKKAFITVDGRIYPCEHIGDFPVLGQVSPAGVDMDSGNVARLFNGWMDKVKQQCASCYDADCCSLCMYYIHGFPEVQACQFHCGFDEFRNSISRHVDILEKKLQLYKKIWDED